MTAPVQIDVRTESHAYPVHVGAGLVDQLGPLVSAAGSTGRRFVISSPPIWKLHGAAVERALDGAEVIMMPDGEQAKTLHTVARLYDALIKAGGDRGATVIGVGGGVVGDVAGFAAATFLRGVRLVHVPSTLLAQVDSAVGGKVGVNHELGKNLIGAFHQPLAVVADPLLLATLPRREFRSGLYEVVKYGVIASRELFERVERDLAAIFDRKPAVLVPVIAESCRIKADVVSQDERESGLRRTLNFGHTVGHAIEAVSRYQRYAHGEAVAYGMLAAAHLAAARGLFPENDRVALAGLIAKLGPLPSVSDVSAAAICKAIRRDKKVLDGRLHMILPVSLGATVTVNDVAEDEIQAALRSIGIRGD